MSRIRVGIALLWGRPEDGKLPLNLRVVRLAGAMLWLVGAITLAVLAAVWPPTQRIGDAGWAVLGAAMAIAVGILIRRLRLAPGSLNLTETLGTAYVGLLGIAVLEWLAGGRASPYHFLYVVPLLFVPAVHSPRRLLVFLAMTVLAVLGPLAYDGFRPAVAAEMLVQLVILLCVAGVARSLFLQLRRQSSALGEARDRAEQTARRDPLTGLGNRLAFEEAVDVEVARARRNPAGLSLIVGDLNNFKAVNDELGHLVGDRLLRHVADCMRNTARRSDECFRWGGDEFVVLLPRTQAREARRVARRIQDAVASTRIESVPQAQLEMTCAVAELAPSHSSDDLLAAADEVLTAVKVGRGEVDNRVETDQGESTEARPLHRRAID
jgi:diguanylate cyclase (GGDEF)-like protein